ncbi:unnamed protein product [Sphagnum tenellum]
MDMHRTSDDVHSSSTTARRTSINRQTDRQDVYSSTIAGRICIERQRTYVHRRTEDAHSSTTAAAAPARSRAETVVADAVLVWGEREGESITRTRSAPISFASFAAAASSASKAHAQVSSSKIDMCS